MTGTRHWKVLLLAAVVSLISMVVPTGTATADHFPDQGSTGACPGRLVGHYPLKADGTTIGELVVYWYEEGGYNCARMNHRGPTAGETHHTYVSLFGCKQKQEGSKCTYTDSGGVDAGNYSQYAGRVFAHGRDRCVAAEGAIKYKGKQHVVKTKPYANHCG